MSEKKNNTMKMTEMEEKVKEIMSIVFNISENDIGELTSPDTVEGWDSLRHMSLVQALEEEFEVQFTDEQIPEMLSYTLILDILKPLLIKD